MQPHGWKSPNVSRQRSRGAVSDLGRSGSSPSRPPSRPPSAARRSRWGKVQVSPRTSSFSSFQSCRFHSAVVSRPLSTATVVELNEQLKLCLIPITCLSSKSASASQTNDVLFCDGHTQAFSMSFFFF